MKLLPTITISTLLGGVALASIGAPPAPAPRSAPARTRAFTGARVIDGTDRPPLANATIVVNGGKVTAVPPAASAPVPPDAERIALDGKTVIPGLVNAHGHVGNTEGLEQGRYSAANVARDLRTYAAYGVTTVFSLGDDQEAGIRARAAQQ